MRWMHDDVSILIALSQFARQQLIDAGFAAERIVVRPNMVNVTPSIQSPLPDAANEGSYAAYVGRIGFEKVVDLLCEAKRAVIHC